MLCCASYTVHEQMATGTTLLSCSSPLVKYHTFNVIVIITVYINREHKCKT